MAERGSVRWNHNLPYRQARPADPGARWVRGDALTYPDTRPASGACRRR